MPMKNARMESERSKRLQPYQKPKNLQALMIVWCVAAIAGMFVAWLWAIVATRPVKVNQPLTPNQIRSIIRDENSKAVEKVKSHVTSETAPARELRQQINAVPRIKYLSDRGGTGRSWTDRLDARLRGTAMEGHGRDFVLAAADNGLPPTLSYAIAYHESGGFRATPPGSNNFYGMKYGNPYLLDQGYSWGKGPDGRFKYQRFNSIAAGIYSHASYIRRTWGFVDSAFDMRGYAESSEWANRVEAERRRV